MAKKKLTIKQEKFVNEYIKTGNGTQSAVKAGYSEKTAYQIAHENLNKPEVAQYIDKRMQSAADKVGMTQEYILNEIKYWIDSRVKESLKALEMGGRHLQMFSDKIDVSVRTQEQALKEIEEMAREDDD
jgi:phage terminase small subunit